MGKNKTGLTVRDVEEHWIKIVGLEKRLKTIKTYIDWKEQLSVSPTQDEWFNVGGTQSYRCETNSLRERRIENLKFQMQERGPTTKKEFAKYIKGINRLQKSEDNILTITSREETPRLFELLDTIIPQEFTPFVYLRIVKSGLLGARMGLDILDGIKELEASNKESPIIFFFNLKHTTMTDIDKPNGITRINLNLEIQDDAKTSLLLNIYLPIIFRLVDCQRSTNYQSTGSEPEKVKDRFIEWWFTFINQRMKKINDNLNILQIKPAVLRGHTKIEVKEGYRQIFEKLCKLPATGFGE